MSEDTKEDPELRLMNQAMGLMSRKGVGAKGAAELLATIETVGPMIVELYKADPDHADDALDRVLAYLTTRVEAMQPTVTPASGVSDVTSSPSAAGTSDKQSDKTKPDTAAPKTATTAAAG
jgi:hypothetical protein